VIPTPGNAVDYTKIREKIIEIGKLYQVKELCADRTFAAMLLTELEAEGFVCVDIPQTFQGMTDPLNQTEVLLKTKQLTHEKNPVAMWAFGNASIAMNGNGQKKLVKEHKGKSVVRTKRIDPVAAWMDAMARARFYESPAKRSVYENRGIREL
jgi:phage terminase large subunit-like protein